MSLNTGEREPPREFMGAAGFTDARNLRMSPASIFDYEKSGLRIPKPGEYYQNNGVIAAVKTNGEVMVWIPKEDPKAPREVPYEKAIRNLKTNGFVEKAFAVPSFE